MRGKRFKEVFSRDFIKKVYTSTGHDMVTVVVINGETFNIHDLKLVDKENYKEYLDMKITDWCIFCGIMKVYIKED